MLIIKGITIPCLIDKYWHFKCPSCGLTRAFREIMHLHFLQALKYNIMSILTFILLALMALSLIIDIVFNKDYTEKIIKYLSKYYVIIFILIMITLVFNNIYL